MYVETQTERTGSYANEMSDLFEYVIELHFQTCPASAFGSAWQLVFETHLHWNSAMCPCFDERGWQGIDIESKRTGI